MRQTRLATISAAFALLIAAAAPISANAAGPDDQQGLNTEATSLSPAVPGAGVPELEQLTLPVIPEGLLQAANDLALKLGDHAKLASVGVSTDRTTIEVYWHGRRTAELNRAVAAAKAAGASVSIKASAYSPQDLRTKAQQLVEGAAGVSVASAGVLADGSGLTVSLALVDSGTRAAQRSAANPEATVSAFADVPVTFKDDAPVTAADPTPSRQLDLYRLGGARIWSYDGLNVLGSCTSAFAVKNPSGGAGLLTAAHCGGTGSRWIAWDKELGGTTWTNFGNIVARSTQYDGAVIDTGSSFPYMWTSGWNSTVYTPINGLVTPLVGQELCYSGSHSGLICGNIVTEKYTYYSLGGDLTNVKGITTVNNAGVPAAGNGDSGGPGYVLSSTSTGFKRYAATVISAIPLNSPPTCSGLPGSSAENGRKCSPTVFSTQVLDILADTGWVMQ